MRTAAFVLLLPLLLVGTAHAQPALDRDPPPGYPTDFPYLATHHGLAGQLVAWPSRELCEVITLSYAEPMTSLRRRLAREITSAGWRIRRNHREPINGHTIGQLIEARRGRRTVLAIFEPRGRRTTLQIYDCGK